MKDITTMRTIKNCRCCGSDSLHNYLNLGKQPLANSYHTGKKLEKFPLEVMLCTNCFHSQLSIVVRPELLFKDYLFLSGITDTFRIHCEALALDAIKRVTSKKIRVLDIACNDGVQLEVFRKLGCEVMGVDPAENLRPITKAMHIDVVVDYWSKKFAEKLKKKFHVITATNVFAHVDDIYDFLEGAKIVLENEGIIILEFPYAKNLIKNKEFDTIYHEHLSYFLVNSLSTLAKRVDLKIVDILQTPIHGGSIRFFLSKSKSASLSKKVALFITKEKKEGLLQEQTYKNFAKQVAINKEKMKGLLQKMKKKNVKIIGYAASAKGNTMLNYFKIKLDYLVDDNDLKIGKLTPGMDIPIMSPLAMREEKKDLVVVILAWNYYNEIARKINAIRQGKHNDKAITYVPRVRVFSISKTSSILVSA